MSRSPNYETDEEPAEREHQPAEVLRIGPGAMVVKGTEGLLVRPPMLGKAAAVPSESVRWVMVENGKPAELLLPGQTSDNAKVTLELDGPAPEFRKRDSGALDRPRFSFRVEVGLREAWFIVIVPTNGQAWDGTVIRTAGFFASYAADKFLRYAVAGWPESGPLPIRYGPRMGPGTRLRMPASFPIGTPMLTAGRPLAPQMKRRNLAALTFLPAGLKVDVGGCIRQFGPVRSEIQAGCFMGMAVNRQGLSVLVCIYVPTTGAVFPPQLAEVAQRLNGRVFKRR